MAYDTKQLRTFKWLDDIAKSKQKYASKFARLRDVYVYCGSLYATNEIVLAKVDYPEFEHLSDWTWSKIIRFCDDRALLLKEPQIEELAKKFPDHRYFDRFFDDEFRPLEVSINPKVLKDGLKGFEINGINPIVYTSENKVFLMGHNKDVSFKVVMMGTR